MDLVKYLYLEHEDNNVDLGWKIERKNTSFV